MHILFFDCYFDFDELLLLRMSIIWTAFHFLPVLCNRKQETFAQVPDYRSWQWGAYINHHLKYLLLVGMLSFLLLVDFLPTKLLPTREWDQN